MKRGHVHKIGEGFSDTAHPRYCEDPRCPGKPRCEGVEREPGSPERGVSHCPSCGRWTEQQERLLRAAQDVVNDAAIDRLEGYGHGCGYVISTDELEALKAVVQEISDDAVKAIEAVRKEKR